MMSPQVAGASRKSLDLFGKKDEPELYYIWVDSSLVRMKQNV